MLLPCVLLPGQMEDPTRAALTWKNPGWAWRHRVWSRELLVRAHCPVVSFLSGLVSSIEGGSLVPTGS